MPDPPTPDSGTAPRLSSADRHRFLWLIWSLPGLLHAFQGWIFEGSYVSPLHILVFCLPLWWPWIPATYLVFRLAERLPLSDELEPLPRPDELDSPPPPEPGPKSWLAHLSAALALSAGHLWLIQVWSRLFSPFERAPLTRETYLQGLTGPIFMVCLSSYLLILCGHYIMSLAQRLHERNLQEARLLGRLAEAEIRSLRMQLRPEALAESLESISAQVRDGELDTAESAIGRLARDLRETLRHGDNLPEVWSNPDLERRSRRRARPST